MAGGRYPYPKHVWYVLAPSPDTPINLPDTLRQDYHTTHRTCGAAISGLVIDLGVSVPNYRTPTEIISKECDREAEEDASS
jgi:hypothetical protein